MEQASASIISSMQISTGGAFIAAIFVDIKLKGISRLHIQRRSDMLDQNELFLKTEATAGLVFAFTGIAILIGIISLIGRICNHKYERESTNRVFSCLVCSIDQGWIQRKGLVLC